MKYLLANGVKTDGKNSDGQTVLQIVAKTGVERADCEACQQLIRDHNDKQAKAEAEDEDAIMMNAPAGGDEAAPPAEEEVEAVKPIVKMLEVGTRVEEITVDLASGTRAW